jgi:hypothetical protein
MGKVGCEGVIFKMHLYLVTRYGSASNPDGPDGPDTNFLVRGRSHEAAAALVDECLGGLTEETKASRPVEPFCHVITEIGLAESDAIEAILHGPWVAHRYLHACSNLRSWERIAQSEDWLSL